MKSFLLTVTLFGLCLVGFGQTIDSTQKVSVSDRFHYQYLKQEKKPTIKQIEKDNEERQRNWQEEFEAMKAGLEGADRISDNVRVTVTTNVQHPNLIVSVSYETVIMMDAADDYALGKYAIENSKACTLMCGFLKEKMENELAEYLKPNTQVDVRVTGATDGTPIRSKIDYKGEYGDFNDKNIILNGKPYKMTVTRQSGVRTNGQLAFLRTQGVEHYLKTQVEPLKHTTNTFEEFAVENKEKGGGYRRVSVEMTIHDAFADVEPENPKKP